VSESAIERRPSRKVSTAHRITVCAQRLTDRHGLDGFTMEDLAVEAGVSRRTLFNYFPGKVDAVLGPGPGAAVPDDVVGEFRDRGPTGDLIEDIGFLMARILTVKGFEASEAEVARRVINSNPRLLAAAHERFGSIVEPFTALVLEREGQAFGRRRARLLLTIIVGLHDLVLDEVLADPTGQRTLPEAYVDALRTTRDLLS
jgi:AcrR family transcriptional regulator